MERIVLEREFHTPLAADDVQRMAAETTCLELYHLKPVRSYLMPGGKRMICIFEGPDAEALRSVGRANGFDGSTIWAATLHTP